MSCIARATGYSPVNASREFTLTASPVNLSISHSLSKFGYSGGSNSIAITSASSRPSFAG